MACTGGRKGVPLAPFMENGGGDLLFGVCWTERKESEGRS